MKSPAFSKHHKGWLVTLIIACQALCFGGGLYLTLWWVEQRTGLLLQEQMTIASSQSGNGGIDLQHSDEEIEWIVEAALTPVKRFGFVMTSVLTLVGAITCVLVIRRFEHNMFEETENLEQVIVERTEDLVRTRDAVILGLAKFAEFRDPGIGRHVERISRYVRILAECLRDEEGNKYTMISDEWIHDLSVGSLLHDIGKVGIPDQILLKPGKLTYEERALIEDHPIIGGECLSAMEEELGDSRLLALAREMGYSHHEWWNGMGYPFKLQGESIPLAARILALADVYDALTTARTYKNAMTHEQAREIIIKGMGSQFDPFVVGSFLLREEDFRSIAEEKDKGELGSGLDLAEVEHDVDLKSLDSVR